MLQRLYTHLAEHPITYVTRERERALGLPEETPGYYIECASDESKSTRELIERFENNLGTAIVVFKPTRQVEELCGTRNWHLLNPPARLAAQVENKVSQITWLESLASALPEHWVGELAELSAPRPFVLQFATGHSGQGTFLIEREEHLAEHIKRFPRRAVRASRRIVGPTFTNNNCVWGGQLLMGSVSLQRTGESELTNNPFATVGNDWEQASQLLGPEDQRQYQELALAVGRKLANSGWKGLFGLDIIREEGTGKLYLIEINARQPASAVFESNLQRLRSDLKGARRSDLWTTTFEAHLAALYELPYEGEELIPIRSGRRTVNRIM